VCQESSRNFTILFQPGFRLEHVEQVSGDANEVKVWSLFDQPTIPVKTEMKVGHLFVDT